LLRPRVLIYSAILLTMIVGMGVGIYYKPDFRLDVLRDRSVMARYTNDGNIENVYNLKLENETEVARDYELKVTGLPALAVHFADNNSQQLKALKPFEKRNVIVEIQVPEGETRAGSHKIFFELTEIETKETIKEKSVFIVPSN